MLLSEIHWSAQAGYPVLGSLQLLPLAGLALMVLLRHGRHTARLGLGLLALQLLLALDLLRRFDPGLHSQQFAERIDLPGALQYHAAVDGVSLLFILLTALLALMAGLYGRVQKLNPAPHYLAAIFALQVALVGMFATRDLLGFALLLGVELLAVAYMLWQWTTSGNDSLAMRRYLQFMGTGLLLLFAAVFLLGWHHAQHAGHWSFALADLRALPLPADQQTLLIIQ